MLAVTAGFLIFISTSSALHHAVALAGQAKNTVQHNAAVQIAHSYHHLWSHGTPPRRIAVRIFHDVSFSSDVLLFPGVLLLPYVLHYSDDIIVVLTATLSSPPEGYSEETVNTIRFSGGCVCASQTSSEPPNHTKHVPRSRAGPRICHNSSSGSLRRVPVPC